MLHWKQNFCILAMHFVSVKKQHLEVTISGPTLAMRSTCKMPPNSTRFPRHFIMLDGWAGCISLTRFKNVKVTNIELDSGEATRASKAGSARMQIVKQKLRACFCTASLASVAQAVT